MVATGPGPANAFMEQTTRMLRTIAQARARGGAIDPRDWTQLEDSLLKALRDLQMRVYVAETDARRMRSRLREVQATIEALER
jgi:hypothetical protein